MQVVLDVQLTGLALVVPNLKTVADAPKAKPVPVMVTLVPPAVEPLFGLTPVTVGRNLKRSFVESALVPPVVVTVTSTVPADSAGDTALIDVTPLMVCTLKLAAFVDPNFTDVAPVKLVPETVTVVPPPTAPLVGLSFVTVGGGGGVRPLTSTGVLLQGCEPRHCSGPVPVPSPSWPDPFQPQHLTPPALVSAHV